MSEIKAPDFIEMDLAKEEADLIAAFEEKTGKNLYPAQVERIMLSVIAQHLYLAKVKFNEGARLNLARFSRAPFIDFIGESLGCKRLKAEKAKSILCVDLFEAFSKDLTIEKGLEVLSKDEKYTFVTTSDLIIKSGATRGLVEIESREACKEVNNYGVGEVKILVKPFSFIKSVYNLNEVRGGSDEEENAAYFERICLAPEGFTCAGSRMAYIYQTLSAHSAILDATAESPQIPASIVTVDTVSNTEVKTIENGGLITGENYTCTVNYKTGEMVLNIGAQQFKITLPPSATVNIYPLTAEDELPTSVKTAVETRLSGKDVTPMTDYVRVYSAVKVDETLDLTVILELNADEEKTKTLVEGVLKDYKTSLRQKLGSEILPARLIALVCNIEGVYSCELKGFEKKSAKTNEFFNLTINIDYERQR